jgi:hypothetical protein
MRVEKIGGALMVHRTDDTHEIVILYPGMIKNRSSISQIRLVPRYARHLASVLIEQATYAEAEAIGEDPQARPYRRNNGAE